MKIRQKIKRSPTKKASKRPSLKTPAVGLPLAKRTGLRHFRLVEHKHTGKLIHHRHTSHLSLAIMLLLVGIFMYISAGFGPVRAQQSAGSVSIGVVVPGPAPTVGATITGPKDGTILTNQATIEVTGSCAPASFVVVLNNDQLVGSGVCTTAGIFIIKVQLQSGVNLLKALNYDNLNQAGPTTPLVEVSVTGTLEQGQSISPQMPVQLVSNPSIVAGLEPEQPSCGNEKAQDLPEGGALRIAVTCVPRFVQLNMQYTLGFVAWGGAPPYALDISWGHNQDETLLSLPTPGSRAIQISHGTAEAYTITLHLKDKEGKSAVVQTAVQVIGDTNSPIASLANDVFHTSWLKTPVPLYLVSVALTLGFWGGDIFDRSFGAHKYRRSPRRTI
ncbi:MAG: hypothetical protein ABI716_00470 [Candidatus Saccharibacteria bacterium]